MRSNCRCPDLRAQHAWEAGLETSYGLTAIAAAFALFAGAVPAWSSIAPCRARAFRSSRCRRGHGAGAERARQQRRAALRHARRRCSCTASASRSGSARCCRCCVARASRRSWIGAGALLPRHPVSAGVLVASGGVLAVVQLGRLDALWTTSYGIVLSCKLAAVRRCSALARAEPLRAGAALQRRRKPRPVGRSRVSIACEIALALAILALVALWRFTPPPRSLLAATPVSIHLHGDKAMAQIEIDAGCAARAPRERLGARRRVPSAGRQGGDARALQSRRRDRAAVRPAPPAPATALPTPPGGSRICVSRSPARGCCGSRSWSAISRRSTAGATSHLAARALTRHRCARNSSTLMLGQCRGRLLIRV